MEFKILPIFYKNGINFLLPLPMFNRHDFDNLFEKRIHGIHIGSLKVYRTRPKFFRF